jgi:hypothetical protein
MAGATATTAAARPLQMNNLALEIIDNSHRKSPRRATTLPLQATAGLCSKVNLLTHCILDDILVLRFKSGQNFEHLYELMDEQLVYLS